MAASYGEIHHFIHEFKNIEVNIENYPFDENFVFLDSYSHPYLLSKKILIEDKDIKEGLTLNLEGYGIAKITDMSSRGIIARIVNNDIDKSKKSDPWVPKSNHCVNISFLHNEWNHYFAQPMIKNISIGETINFNGTLFNKERMTWDGKWIHIFSKKMN